MINYLTQQLEIGKMNYNTIFGIDRYKQFQSGVDAKLAADGYKVRADGTVVKVEVSYDI